MREVVALRRGAMRLARRLRSEGPTDGLSSTKLSLLGRLSQAGDLTAGALAAAEGLQPQSLTRVLAELEYDGLVRRRPADTDRRQSLVALTPNGFAALAHDMHTRDEWLAAAMRHELSEAERSLLRLAGELMERLADYTVSTVS
jgi:DNA-binding MarR family transcriptional regulator